jgi:hypothetical protein
MADIKLPARSLHIYYREENNLFGRIGQRGVRGSQSRSSSGQRGWWGNPCGFKSRLRHPTPGGNALPGVPHKEQLEGHHCNTQRKFGFAPSSLFFVKTPRVAKKWFAGK